MKKWLYINLIASLIICAFIMLTNLNRERCAAISYGRADYYKGNETTKSEYFMKEYIIPRASYDNLDKDIKEKYIIAVNQAAFLAEASKESKNLSLVLFILLFISVINLMNIKKTANKKDASNPSSPDR